jgi:hypothetical protein
VPGLQQRTLAALMKIKRVTLTMSFATYLQSLIDLGRQRVVSVGRSVELYYVLLVVVGLLHIIRFVKTRESFTCVEHRGKPKFVEGAKTFLGSDGTTVRHSLFSQNPDLPTPDLQDHLDIGGTKQQSSYEEVSDDNDDESADIEAENKVDGDTADEEAESDENEEVITNLSLIDKITYLKVRKPNIQSKLVRIYRHSLDDAWNIELFASPIGHQRQHVINGVGCKTASSNGTMFVITVASASEKESDPFDPLLEGDIIKSVNGVYIGSPELDSVVKVINSLSKETDVILEIQRYRMPH